MFGKHPVHVKCSYQPTVFSKYNLVTIFMFSNTGVSFLSPCEDPKVRDLFDKIAKYRKMWSLQLNTWSDWGDDVDAQDDDQYTNAGDSNSPSPEPSPSGHVPGKVGASPLYEEMKAVCADVGMTPDQEKELHDMLMQIQEFESDTPKNVQCYSQFFPLSCYPAIGQYMPMPLVFDAVGLSNVLPCVSWHLGQESHLRA